MTVKIMGIVNVTPDSFSDGGKFFNPASAIAHAKQLIEEGADILDIGGESTRPGAAPVSPQAELDRVLPVIEGLKNCGVMISIDTRNASTMTAAIAAGATMINDVTALTGQGSLAAAAAASGPVCLMHMQGTPQTMQDNPTYNDVVQDVYDHLSRRIETCIASGIDRARLYIDPGIGFGKTTTHNVQILQNLSVFTRLAPVVLGASRKRFIADLAGEPLTPDQRLPGSLAAAALGASQGVSILRVHDVAQTRRFLSVFLT